MDIAQDTNNKNNTSPATSPHSNVSSNGSSTPKPPTPPTPQPISTSNPFPTTFVQADTSTFKQVVQILTGSSNSSVARNVGGSSIPPIKSIGPKKQGFKLYERRNSLKNGLMINTLTNAGYSSNSPRNHELLSPSVLDFPSLVIGPGTPLNADKDGYNYSCKSPLAEVEEDRAIAQKKFYFHPSPRNIVEPQLLSLFPVTSPRLSDSSACLTNGEIVE